MKQLKVRNIMAASRPVIDPSVSLLEAAARMIDEAADAFIVTPLEKDEPFGIITTRDIVELFAGEVDVGSVTVGEVASKPLIIVSPGMPVLYAAKLFKKAGVDHLAVFNGREILGVISLDDVVKSLPLIMEQLYSEFSRG